MNKRTTTPKTESKTETKADETEKEVASKTAKRDVRLISPFGVDGPRKQLEAIIEQNK